MRKKKSDGPLDNFLEEVISYDPSKVLLENLVLKLKFN